MPDEKSDALATWIHKEKNRKNIITRYLTHTFFNKTCGFFFFSHITK